MNRRKALKRISKGCFGVCLYTAGLYPLDELFFGEANGGKDFSPLENRKKIDEYASISPNDAQLNFLRELSERYDYVLLGDTNHSRFEVNLFALHPKTVAALSSDTKQHYFIERSPSYDWVFSGQLERDQFLGECSDIRTSFVKDDSFYHALCENMNVSMQGGVINFVPVDQRFTVGKALFDNVTPIQRASLLPYKYSHELQGQLYGQTSILAPSMLLALAPPILSGQFTNDRDTTNAMIDIAPNGGVVLYGSGHFDDNYDWSFERQDMPYLLREAGFSVCVVNINLSAKHHLAWAFENGADADLDVFTSEDNPSGVSVNNPDLESILQRVLNNQLVNDVELNPEL